MLIFQKIWAFIKKYWGIFAIVAIAVIGLFILRDPRLDLMKRIKQLQEAHDDEIRRIDAIREAERAKNDANEKRLSDALKVVQEKYENDKQELSAKKKAEIVEIVREYGDDVDELAKQLSEATGFEIVMSE